MNALWILARKDLRLLCRDRVSLFWMLGMPLVFAAFFGAVFGGSGPGESNPLRVAVVQEGLTDAGRKLAQRLDASAAIEVEELPRQAAIDAVRRGQKLAFLELKKVPEGDFSMFAGEMPVLELGIDPSRTAEKGLLKGLLSEAVFAGFRDLLSNPEQSRSQVRRMRDRLKDDPELGAVQKLAFATFFGALDDFLGVPQAGGGAGAAMEPQITEVAVARTRRGPPNAYSISFPQSILWAILGSATGFAISLVRERRNGTLVRLLTAPISHATVLAGKSLACALSCLLTTAVLLAVGVVVFQVQIGSVPLLVLAAVAAAVCYTGITMLLGSLGETEQAVSGLAWGILLSLSMLGGGMVPQIAMPAWMLQIGAISPARWTIQALEGAIWRDFSLAEMVLPCSVLLGIGVVTFWLGAKRLAQRR